MINAALTPINEELTQSNNSAAFMPVEFLQKWEAWNADRAQSTQKGYSVTVKAFLCWCLDNGIEKPQRADIIAYKQYLLTPHQSRKNNEIINFTADTAARYFRGVKMFFEFLEANGLYQNITKNIRSPKTKPTEFKRDYLEREDVIKLLNSIDQESISGKRNYALILLIVSCAFRVIEIQRANIGDIEEINGTYRLYIQGKGHTGKDAYKRIEPEVMEALTRYINTREDISNNAPLFAAIASNAKPGGGRLTNTSISRIVKEVLLDAGYNSKRITAHSLRHTSVTLDRAAGGSLEDAQHHARHSAPTVTQRYDHSIEKKEARDERRILDYLFKGETASTSNQAEELFNRIPQRKQKQAIEILKAFAD